MISTVCKGRDLFFFSRQVLAERHYFPVNFKAQGLRMSLTGENASLHPSFVGRLGAGFGVD